MKFLALLASVVLSFFPTQTSQIVGSAVPSTPALIDTYLATNIDNSQTSMTLANGLTRAGTALSGYMCFVIDINSPTTEYVCGTASSTSITSLSRGVDVLNPNSTSSALAYPHRRFASVQISDYPTLQVLVRKVNGTDTWDSKITYTTAPTFSNGNDIINKTYADNLAIAGAPNGSTIQKGIYQEASTTNIGNGTAVGSTGADLIVPNKYFNTTSSATTTVPVTNSSGTLSQGFLDLTQAFTFSGGVTSTATTSLAATNITGTATFSTTTRFNGTATTTFISPVLGAGFTHAQYFTTVGTSTWTKPTDVQRIFVIAIGGGGSGGGSASNVGGGGGAGGRGEKIIDVSATSSVVVTVGAAATSSSFGAYITANPGNTGGTTSNLADGGSGGTATGGDINITGDSGSMGVIITGPIYLGGKGGVGYGFSYGNGGHGGGNTTGSAGNQGIVIVYW